MTYCETGHIWFARDGTELSYIYRGHNKKERKNQDIF